jgi:predicted GNAT family N-acyltransferase
MGRDAAIGGDGFTVAEVPWPDAGAVLAAIRREVFVIEQGVPESLEWDGLDGQCRHVLARAADGTGIGTGRLLPDGHVGRMAVLAAWRGRGVGAALLHALIGLGAKQGFGALVLHAQVHAIGFYRRAGFVETGEPFMEAGIPHVVMQLSLANSPPPRA